ncbi:hypothetical protein GCM10028805_47540 [Spirosoma harenae]
MNTFQLTIQGKRFAYKGPSTWSELSARQAVILMRVRDRVQTELELLFVVLELLYGMHSAQQRWLFDEGFLRRKGLSEEGRLLALANGQALLDELTWIGETLPGSKFLVPQFRLYDFQFGSAKVLRERLLHLTVYHSPGEALNNSTFGEFMCAEEAYKAQNWAELAAVLYRPSGKSAPDDKRERFEKTAVDGRAELFTRLDPALLSLIKTQYEASQQEIYACFPNVFISKEPNETATTTEEPSKGNWLEVTLNMAKCDPTKVIDIENVNVYLALKSLDLQIRQADELEEQLTEMRKQ